MSQGSYVIPLSGPNAFGGASGVASQISAALLALAGMHAGSSAPANGPGGAPTPYQLWANTTTNPAVVSIYDGANWVQIGTLDATAHVFTLTAAYSVSTLTGLGSGVLTALGSAAGAAGGFATFSSLGTGAFAAAYTLPTASLSTLGGVKVDGSTVTINGSGVISAPSSYVLPTASLSTLGGVKVDGSTVTINGSGVISASLAGAAPPRGSIGGLTLSNDGTTPNTVLDIAAGAAASDDNLTLMTLASAFTKSISSTWTAGTGNGALDIGSVAASTWYHVYLIENTTGPVVDVLLSQGSTFSGAVTATSASPAVFTFTAGSNPLQYNSPVVLSGSTAPTGFTLGVTYYALSVVGATFQLSATQGGVAINSTSTGSGLTATSNPKLPTGYTKKRRIGSIKTNGSSQIIAFSQNGNEFLWGTPVNDYTNTTLGTSAATATLSTPLGVKTNALINAGMSGLVAGITVLINSLDQAVSATNSPSGNSSLTFSATGAIAYASLSVRTSFSSQIRVVASSSNTTLNVATYGWIDTRGALA